MYCTVLWRIVYNRFQNLTFQCPWYWFLDSMKSTVLVRYHSSKNWKFDNFAFFEIHAIALPTFQKYASSRHPTLSLSHSLLFSASKYASIGCASCRNSKRTIMKRETRVNDVRRSILIRQTHSLGGISCSVPPVWESGIDWFFYRYRRYGTDKPS